MKRIQAVVLAGLCAVCVLVPALASPIPQHGVHGGHSRRLDSDLYDHDDIRDLDDAEHDMIHDLHDDHKELLEDHKDMQDHHKEALGDIESAKDYEKEHMKQGEGYSGKMHHESSPEGYGEHSRFYVKPEYAFKYGVYDPHTGDVKSAWEHREGEDTRGGYAVLEPDGHTRVVEYSVSKHGGFNAKVKHLPPHEAHGAGAS